MEDFLAGLVDLGAGAELQEAAGIRGGDGLRLGFRRMLHFFRK